METMKKFLLVTNNDKALKTYQDDAVVGVEYLADKSYLDVLIRVRDRIHTGWHLMSHPQASNLKPNQSPYKTILISCGAAAEPFVRDIELIESALMAYDKFTKGMLPPRWSERALADFKTVDLAVVQSAFQSSLLRQMMLSHS